MNACVHEHEPHPSFVVVDRGQTLPDPLPDGWVVVQPVGPLPVPAPSRYVPCLLCGEALDRGAYRGLTSDPWAKR